MRARAGSTPWDLGHLHCSYRIGFLVVIEYKMVTTRIIKSIPQLDPTAPVPWSRMKAVFWAAYLECYQLQRHPRHPQADKVARMATSNSRAALAAIREPKKGWSLSSNLHKVIKILHTKHSVMFPDGSTAMNHLRALDEFPFITQFKCPTERRCARQLLLKI